MGIFKKIFNKNSKKENVKRDIGLQKSIMRLSELKGQLFVPDIEAEVINYACWQLFKDGKTEIFEFMEYANTYSKIAEELFVPYNSSHSAAAQASVIQNMGWEGMRDFLREYYRRNHRINIDI